MQTEHNYVYIIQGESFSVNVNVFKPNKAPLN